MAWWPLDIGILKRHTVKLAPNTQVKAIIVTSVCIKRVFFDRALTPSVLVFQCVYLAARRCPPSNTAQQRCGYQHCWVNHNSPTGSTEVNNQPAIQELGLHKT